MDFNKKSRLTSLSFSVLLHLLFLFIFIFLSVYSPKDKIHQSSPSQISAYVYKEKPSPMIQQHRSKRTMTIKNKSRQQLTVDKKEHATNTQITSQSQPRKSMLVSSMEILQKNQISEMMASQKELEPIYLFGDLNAPSDPFILLLAKAISANFSYPKLAGEMGVRGRVIVSFVVHPEGYFSNVQVIQSSYSEELDRAALYAVNEAPTIEGLDRFLSKPKRLVVGFIFR